MVRGQLAAGGEGSKALLTQPNVPIWTRYYKVCTYGHFISLRYKHMFCEQRKRHDFIVLANIYLKIFNNHGINQRQYLL